MLVFCNNLEGFFAKLVCGVEAVLCILGEEAGGPRGDGMVGRQDGGLLGDAGGSDTCVVARDAARDAARVAARACLESCGDCRRRALGSALVSMCYSTLPSKCHRYSSSSAGIFLQFTKHPPQDVCFVFQYLTYLPTYLLN